MRLAYIDRQIVRGLGWLGGLLRFRQLNAQIAQRRRPCGSLAVYINRKPLAGAKAGAVCVINNAHIVSVINKPIQREIADRRVSRN